MRIERSGNMDGMELPERFVIVLEGKLWDVRKRTNMVPDELPYLLGRLLTGASVAPSAFEGYGLRVTVERDADQGEDGADELSIRQASSPAPR